jgi:DNA-binding response OmpR family regulator
MNQWRRSAWWVPLVGSGSDGHVESASRNGRRDDALTTVLVCDDEPVLRELLRASLAGDDYDIAEAADGEEALSLVRRLRPDLVIIDMMMPLRSGIDVVREVRGDPELDGIPVLMLTAMTHQADRELAAQIGVDEFLAKPFIPRELAAVVQQLVRQPR